MHSFLAFFLTSDFAYMLGNHPKDEEDTESRVLSIDSFSSLCIFLLILDVKPHSKICN